MSDSRRLTPGWRLHATVAALALPPLVYFVSLERVAGWIDRTDVRRLPDPTVDDDSLAEWVDRLLGWLPPPWKRTCLKRALVLHYLTRKSGRPAELRIGVRRDERRELAAHAWLTRDTRAYLEPGTGSVDSYRVLATFPAQTQPRP